MTTQSMVGSPNWKAGLVYVDLFSGPGLCQDKDSGKIYPGSPLIAANAAKPFRKIVVCDLDPANTRACRSRLDETAAGTTSVVLTGNSNELVEEVATHIPPGALTLAFLDPEGLDLQYTTVQRLARCGRVDLLILLPDAYDIVRNVKEYYKDANSKLDHVLGLDSNWRAAWDTLHNRSGGNVREFFIEMYERQIRKAGYQEFGYKTIEGPSGPLYKLAYASKHSRGLDFWNKVLEKDRGGQKGFWGQ